MLEVTPLYSTLLQQFPSLEQLLILTDLKKVNAKLADNWILMEVAPNVDVEDKTDAFKYILGREKH
jgi:hypothetical protein